MLDISAIDGGKPYPAVFIRAPAITSIYDDELVVLARVSTWILVPAQRRHLFGTILLYIQLQ